MIPADQALSNALADARRNSPYEVTIRAYADEAEADRTLAERRMKVVADALRQGGVPESSIRPVVLPTDAAGFQRLGSAVDIQLSMGTPPAEGEAASGQ